MLDAHLSYHLNAGVDFVIAAVHDANRGAVELLEPYVRDGSARVVFERPRYPNTTSAHGWQASL